MTSSQTLDTSTVDNFRKFLQEKQIPSLIRILLEEEENIHYALFFDASALLEMFPELSEPLFFRPSETIEMFNTAAKETMKDILKSHMLKSHMTLKPFLHVRINKLPECNELQKDRVPKSQDVGKFLAVKGTVIRTNSVKILEYEKEFICQKCQNVFTLKSDFELHNVVAFPSHCPVDPTCNSKKFISVDGKEGGKYGKKCKDYQEIRLQEQVRKLSLGIIPRCINVVLEDDLVDSCKAGDDVVVFGEVTCRWNSFTVGKFCDVETTIRANNIEVWNRKQTSSIQNFSHIADEFDCFWAAHAHRPMDARNHILASLCPQVYGLYVVKLAVALVLAGGVPRVSNSGSTIRGESHLLLVGDPGTGKSQFLKYVAKITQRSIVTTGIGSSAAGLTVSAVRDGPHWSLEAGALVLADGGFCCIDEFSSIKDHDRAAIHEAMEQQSISVAKAGLVCKLSTKTSIIAATNPKFGKYDENSSVSMNIAIASPLLSRFDIVLLLIDSQNHSWDEVVADYLLGDQAMEELSDNRNNLWSLKQMQEYFVVIKQLKPTLGDDADLVLKSYYRCHRKSSSASCARTTIRLLESLIRLAEAHARLMYREVVLIQDAIAAVTIMESSMHGCSLLSTGSILHSNFPTDPMEEFEKHTTLVLQALDLEHLLELAGTQVIASTQQISKKAVDVDFSFEPSQTSVIEQKKSNAQELSCFSLSEISGFSLTPDTVKIPSTGNECESKSQNKCNTAKQSNFSEDFTFSLESFLAEENDICDNFQATDKSFDFVPDKKHETEALNNQANNQSVFCLNSTSIEDICKDFES